jgi:hypothetical protein
MICSTRLKNPVMGVKGHLWGAPSGNFRSAILWLLPLLEPFCMSCDFFALVRPRSLQLFSRLSHLRSGLP